MEPSWSVVGDHLAYAHRMHSEPSAQQKGRALEQSVALFYEANGYHVATNLHLTGRSGVTHEIDVLATKSDELTDFRVGVECKSWNRPVDKDVVAKAAYVFADLGIGNGVIIAPGGATDSARTAAADNNLAVWDETTLTQKLRSVGLDISHQPKPRRLLCPGRRSQDSPETHTLRSRQLEALIDRRENLVAVSRLWLPAVFIDWDAVVETGALKKQVSTIHGWTSIDGVAETYGYFYEEARQLDELYERGEEVELPGAVLPAYVDGEAAASQLAGLLHDHASGTSSRRVRKDVQRLFGIDPVANRIKEWIPRRHLTAWYDTYAGLVSRGRAEHVYLVDAASGDSLPELASLLSTRIRELKALDGFRTRQRFAGAPPPPPPPPPPQRERAVPEALKASPSAPQHRTQEETPWYLPRIPQPTAEDGAAGPVATAAAPADIPNASGNAFRLSELRVVLAIVIAVLVFSTVVLALQARTSSPEGSSGEASPAASATEERLVGMTVRLDGEAQVVRRAACYPSDAVGMERCFLYFDDGRMKSYLAQTDSTRVVLRED